MVTLNIENPKAKTRGYLGKIKAGYHVFDDGSNPSTFGIVRRNYASVKFFYDKNADDGKK